VLKWCILVHLYQIYSPRLFSPPLQKKNSMGLTLEIPLGYGPERIAMQRGMASLFHDLVAQRASIDRPGFRQRPWPVIPGCQALYSRLCFRTLWLQTSVWRRHCEMTTDVCLSVACIDLTRQRVKSKARWKQITPVTREPIYRSKGKGQGHQDD